MRKIKLLSVLCLLTLGCQKLGDGALTKPREFGLFLQADLSLVTRATSVEEERLLGRLRTLVSVEQYARVLEILANPKVFRIPMRSNPPAESVLDSVFENRHKISRSRSLALQNATEIGVSATVVLVDSLRDRTAVAEIRRRVNQVPMDVVLLPVDATPASWASATRALARLRRNGGDRPSQNVRVVLHPAGRPYVRDPRRRDQAVSELRALRQSPLTNVAGLGLVRSREIILGSAASLRKKVF